MSFLRNIPSNSSTFVTFGWTFWTNLQFSLMCVHIFLRMWEHFHINVPSFQNVQTFSNNLDNNISFGMTRGRNIIFGCLKYSMNIPLFSNVPKYILENGWIIKIKGTSEGKFLQVVEHFSNYFSTVANIYEKVESKWEQVAKMLQSLKSQYFSNQVPYNIYINVFGNK